MPSVNVSDACIGCSACASAAPEYFEMKDGKAHPKGTVTDVAKAKQAAGVCPVGAITVSE